jgi:hypothetical protein
VTVDVQGDEEAKDCPDERREKGLQKRPIEPDVEDGPAQEDDQDRNADPREPTPEPSTGPSTAVHFLAS